MRNIESAKKPRYLLAYLIFALIVLFALPFLGATLYTPSSIAIEPARTIFWDLRVPRVIVAILVGGGLAISGMIFQSIFHNPLACPFSLGVSSGAACGAALAIAFGLSASEWPIAASTIAAGVGALGSAYIVLQIAKLALVQSATTLLLAGLVISYFFGSVIVALQYICNEAELFRLSRWMMGSVSSLGYSELTGLGTVVILLVVWSLVRSKELDLLGLGDELASVRGVDVPRLRREAFIITSLVTGVIVAFCGVIGFVGIIVPQAARLIVGHNHRLLSPICFLIGALLLALCDTLGRTVLSPLEVPVGVFTAILGGPSFVWILIRRV